MSLSSSYRVFLTQSHPSRVCKLYFGLKCLPWVGSLEWPYSGVFSLGQPRLISRPSFVAWSLTMPLHFFQARLFNLWHPCYVYSFTLLSLGSKLPLTIFIMEPRILPENYFKAQLMQPSSQEPRSCPKKVEQGLIKYVQANHIIHKLRLIKFTQVVSKMRIFVFGV